MFILKGRPAHRLSSEDRSEASVPQRLNRLHVGHEGEIPLWRLQMVEGCHHCNRYNEGQRSTIQF